MTPEYLSKLFDFIIQTRATHGINKKFQQNIVQTPSIAVTVLVRHEVSNKSIHLMFIF